MLASLLDQIPDLDGTLISMDELHAQREHAACLHKRGAHYLVTVKGNQPGLLTRLRRLPWKDVPPGHVCEGRAHRPGREADPQSGHRRGRARFPHAAQAIQITRKTRAERHPEAEDRDQLRHHQPARRKGPPGPARHLDPGPLENRKPIALGP